MYTSKMLRIYKCDQADTCYWGIFPKAPHYHEDQGANGPIEYLFTPPVSQGRQAIRLVARRYLDASGKVTSHDIQQERTAGWYDFPSRSNWAGYVYGDDPTGRHKFAWEYEKKVPLQLYNRWMPDIYRFCYVDNPAELKERLDAHQRSTNYHKQNQAQRQSIARTNEQRYGRVEHGDIFLVERPISFKDGTHRQAFLALRSNAKGSKIKSYTLPTCLPDDRDIYPVRASFGQIRRVDMFKLCPAVFQDLNHHYTAHEQMELFTLQKQIHESIDRFQIL
jgi:hypothetical protein